MTVEAPRKRGKKKTAEEVLAEYKEMKAMDDAALIKWGQGVNLDVPCANISEADLKTFNASRTARILDHSENVPKPISTTAAVVARYERGKLCMFFFSFAALLYYKC